MSNAELTSAETLRQLGLDRLPGISVADVEYIVQSTIECAAWCKQRAKVSDPEGSLRSDGLRPTLIIGSDVSTYEWNRAVGDPAEVVRNLCEKRSNQIGNALAMSSSQPIHDGRYVAFWPTETLSDGAACELTHGYFDVANIPPWDTWVYYRIIDNSPVLIAWVPPAFIDSVSEGLWTNPEESIRWLRNDLQFANYHRHSTISAQN